MQLGVCAVIVDAAGCVLLGRRDRPPIWNMPGGGVEVGEAPWDAAVRETREEMDVVVEVVRLTGVYDRSPDGDPVLVFRCRLVSGRPTVSAEATAVGWFDPRQLPQPINPYHPTRIRDALRTAPDAVLRHQPGLSVRTLFPDP